MMLRCWQQKPKLRPTFLSIVSDLEHFVTTSFVETSFYHNRQRGETTSSCVRVETEKDGFPELPSDVMPPSPMTDPDARESVV